MVRLPAALGNIGQGPKHKWWVLLTVAVGIYMAVLDGTIITIALPAMADGFSINLTTVQWAVLAYLFATSVFLLPAGRMGDMRGRKLVYCLGFALFILGSLLSGLAPSIGTLSVFRVIQALGAAALMANGQSAATAAFPAHERGKVLGITVTVVALGAISGPTLGGIIVDSIGWRWTLFINIPIGVIGLLLATLILREDATARPLQGPARPRRFDWWGTLLSGAALIAALLAMTRGQRWGWTSPLTVGSLIAAAALAVAFVYAERRPDPIMPLELFRRWPFSAGLLTSFLLFTGMSGNMLLMPFYLQRVLNYSAGDAGLLLLPFPLSLAIAGPIGGRLADKVSSRALASAGLVLVIISLANLAFLDEQSSIMRVIAWQVGIGLGMGIFSPPNNSSIYGAVARSDYGVTAALSNLARNLGQTIGVPVASLIVALTMIQAGVEPEFSTKAATVEAATVSAFADGLRNSYFAASFLVVMAMAVSLSRGRGRPAEAPSAAAQVVATSERRTPPVEDRRPAT